MLEGEKMGSTLTATQRIARPSIVPWICMLIMWCSFFLLKYCTEYMTWVNRGLSWRVGSVLILQFFFVLIYIIIFFISHSLLSLPFPFSSKIVQSLMYGGSCAETLSKKWENASLCSQEIGFPKRYLAFKRAWLPAMDNRTHGIRQVVNVVVPRPKV